MRNDRPFPSLAFLFQSNVSPPAVVVLLMICVIVRKGYPCCCGGGKRDKNAAQSVQQGGVEQEIELSMAVDRDPFCSSGGGSDSGVSLAGLAEMGGLSPVQEETAEVVTTNPMIKAIANGAQFHSGGGDSSKFHSVGNSSKFQSVGGDSAKFHSVGESSKFHSVGESSKFHSVGDSSKFQSSVEGGAGEDEEEGGGMFADADVVAALAAAAAREAEQNDPVRITSVGRAGSRWGWQQGSDGGWVKSPSLLREESPGVVDTKSGFSARGLGPTSAEEKAADAAGTDASPTGRPAPAADWMVSTRKSFNAKTGSIAASWLGALEASKAKGREVAREEEKTATETETAGSPGPVNAGMPGVFAARVSSMEEKTEELVDEGGQAVVVEGGDGENAADQGGPPVAQAPAQAPSPQLVDGISPQAFGQAEVVAKELPAVAKGRSASEPECEVPKPVVLGADVGRRMLGEYAWLSTSGRNLLETANTEETPVVAGDTSPQVPLDSGSGSTTEASVTRVGVPLPGLAKTKPTASGKLRAADPVYVSVLPADSAVDRETKTTGSVAAAAVAGDENGQKSEGESEQHEKALHLPPKPQGTPRRTLLTPRASGGRGFNSAAPDLVLDQADASSVTPSRATRSLMATPDRLSRVSEVVQAFESMTPKRSGPGVWTPGAFTPASTTPGATHWSTPLATPDRTPREMKLAPEELSTVSTPGNGAGRAWATQVATPDRSPTPTAPDSGTGGATPERTVSPAHESRVNVGVSPTDEGPHAWQLESPAGVDGFPSPTGSDIRTMAFKKKGGRMIPTILGAVDAVAAAEGTSVLTPSMVDNKPLLHRMDSSGDSSSGAGWEAEACSSTEPSFGASQVAAFVADAQAEAAADAEAAEEAGAESKAVTQATAEKAGAESKAVIQATAEEEAGAESKAAAQATTDVTAEEVTPVLPEAAMLTWSQAEVDIDGDADTDADEGSFDGAVAWPARQLPPEIAAAQSEESDSEEDEEVMTNVPEAAGTEVVVAVVVRGVLGEGEDGVVDDNEVEVDSLAEADGFAPKALAVAEENATDIKEGDKAGEEEEGAVDTKTWEAIEGGEKEQREVVSEELVLVDTGKEHEQSPVDEAAEVAALVAEAMALADKDGNVVEALYQVAGDEGASDTAPRQAADGSTDGAQAATSSNPRKTVGELAKTGSFGSSKSILTWAEGDGTEEGDAERDAQEVQALVAEALALVKEASEEAKDGDAVEY